MATYEIPSWMKIEEVYEGNPVVRSYGIDLQSGIILRRTVDRSEPNADPTWEIANLSDEEQTKLENWNSTYGHPSVSADYRNVQVSHEAAGAVAAEER